MLEQPKRENGDGAYSKRVSREEKLAESEVWPMIIKGFLLVVVLLFISWVVVRMMFNGGGEAASRAAKPTLEEDDSTQASTEDEQSQEDAQEGDAVTPENATEKSWHSAVTGPVNTLWKKYVPEISADASFAKKIGMNFVLPLVAAGCGIMLVKTIWGFFYRVALAPIFGSTIEIKHSANTWLGNGTLTTTCVKASGPKKVSHMVKDRAAALTSMTYTVQDANSRVPQIRGAGEYTVSAKAGEDGYWKCKNKLDYGADKGAWYTRPFRKMFGALSIMSKSPKPAVRDIGYTHPESVDYNY